jgi:hypothetical protein
VSIGAVQALKNIIEANRVATTVRKAWQKSPPIKISCQRKSSRCKIHCRRSSLLFQPPWSAGEFHTAGPWIARRGNVALARADHPARASASE